MTDTVGTVGPEATDELFAKNMRYLREQALMSLAAFVRCLKEHGWETHINTVVRIEKGEQRPRLGEAKVIASVLGVTVEQMTTSAASQIAAVQQEVATFVDKAESALEAGQRLMRPQVLDLVGEVRHEDFYQLAHQFNLIELIVERLTDVLRSGEGKALADLLIALGVR